MPTSPVKAISVTTGGTGQSCAILTSGVPYCWGDDSDYNDILATTPSSGDFTKIAVNRFAACGIEADGSLQCWGNPSHYTGIVSDAPASGSFTDIALGYGGACARRDNGELFCWANSSHDIETDMPSGTFFSGSYIDPFTSNDIGSNTVAIAPGSFARGHFEWNMSGGTITESYTLADGANRVLLVGVTHHGGYYGEATVTYGGESMTLGASVSDNTRIFYLANPPTGANDIVIDYTYSYPSSPTGTWFAATIINADIGDPVNDYDTNGFFNADDPQEYALTANENSLLLIKVARLGSYGSGCEFYDGYAGTEIVQSLSTNLGVVGSRCTSASGNETVGIDIHDSCTSGHASAAIAINPAPGAAACEGGGIVAAYPCEEPIGQAGDITYNLSHDVFQGCTPDGWQALHVAVGGGSSDPCHPTNTPSPGQTCEDGTIYAGESPDGDVAMYTTSSDEGLFPWNNGNTSGYVTTNQTSVITGQSNTANLINIDSDNDTGGDQPHQAAQECANLSAHGHGDWYLPARDELNVLYANKNAGDLDGTFDERLQPPPTAHYWSSSEYGSNVALYRRFNDGTQGNHAKDNGYAVRCVRNGYIVPSACQNPSGQVGDMIYNTSEDVYQGCTADGWHAFHQ